MSIKTLDSLINDWECFSKCLIEKLDSLALSESSKKIAIDNKNKIMARFLRKLFSDRSHTPIEIERTTSLGKKEDMYGITVGDSVLFLTGVFNTQDFKPAFSSSKSVLRKWLCCNEIDERDKASFLIAEAMWFEFKSHQRISELHVFSFFFGKYVFKALNTNLKFLRYTPFIKKALKAHKLIKPLVGLAKAKPYQDRLGVKYNLTKLFTGVKESKDLYKILDTFSDFIPETHKECKKLFSVLSSTGIKFKLESVLDDYWVEIKIETDYGNFYI